MESLFIIFILLLYYISIMLPLRHIDLHLVLLLQAYEEYNIIVIIIMNIIIILIVIVIKSKWLSILS